MQKVIPVPIKDLEKINRGLVLVEAAVEGADMGDESLKDAISGTLLDVLKVVTPLVEAD
jgi:hypothetical protein